VEDKETNTECAFSGNGENDRVPTIIKRSQTFSPTAKNQYICKVSLKLLIWVLTLYVNLKIVLFFS